MERSYDPCLKKYIIISDCIFPLPGSGIGRQACISFAKAGAARIVALGRREEILKETASLVASSSSQVETLVRSADTTDLKALEKIAAEVGKWDVLVIASVHASAVATLASSDIDEWWQGFEVSLDCPFLGTVDYSIRDSDFFWDTRN